MRKIDWTLLGLLFVGCLVSSTIASTVTENRVTEIADERYEMQSENWKEIVRKLEVARDVEIIRADVERERWQSLVDQWPDTPPLIPSVMLDDDDLLTRYMRLEAQE